MRHFEQLHPAIQLDKLVSWYWQFVEGGDDRSRDLFNENMPKAYDEILKYAGQIDSDIYCTAVASLRFSFRHLNNCILCPALYEGYKQRLDEIDAIWKDKATESIKRDRKLCSALCELISLTQSK